MYINIEKLEKSGLLPGDLEVLVGIKFNQSGKKEEYLNKHLTEAQYKRFNELSLLKEVKGKQSINNRLRTSDKANKLLIELSYEGTVDEESQKLADWVIKIYKSRKGAFIKNKTELVRRIHWFKTITNITGNHLALLIQCAILDTYDPDCGETFYEAKEKNNRLLLNNMAERLYWAETSIMDKHKTLDKSPLYDYYIDNQAYIEEVWRKNNLEVI